MKITLEQVPEFAADFLKSLDCNLVCLSGNLGAGKTTFTQHIAKHLYIEEKITSPTFVLMKKYPIDFRQFKNLIHIDAYRIEDPEELVKVGDEIEVKVLRVDTDERKIGLSRKRVEWGEEQEKAAAAEEAALNAGTLAQVSDSDLKGGLGGGDGPLIPTGN